MWVDARQQDRRVRAINVPRANAFGACGSSATPHHPPLGGSGERKYGAMPSADIIAAGDLTALQDELLVYAHNRAAPGLCARLGRAAGGVVTRLETTAAELRRGGFDGALVIDPARYDRDAPVYEQLPFGGVLQDWVDRQAQHRVAAYLSPSPYVGDGDFGALQAIIDDGVEFCRLCSAAGHPAPGFLVVPVARSWLTTHLDPFVSRLGDAAVPVALMLGDPTDPLGSQAAVEGLVAMVTALDAVALMRSDLSAIGAVAWGALMGSIGTLTSSRHFVQPTKRAGGVSGDKTPSVLVEGIVSYVRGSKLEYVEGDGGFLTCHCPVCDGRSLTRFGQTLHAHEAFFHNQHVWQAIAAKVLGQAAAARPAAWREVCERALDALVELEARTGVSFPPPGYLRAWSQLA